jgi:hypothetical protein
VSNFLAIATVTEALRQLLQAEVEDDLKVNVSVTMTRPEVATNGNQDPRVNIYLFRVTPNAALRNRDLPQRNRDGVLQERPVSALDLHYLFSFFGNDANLMPQRLLGSTVRTLHAFPVITREMLDTVIGATTFTFLKPSNLGEQTELVKFTPTQHSLDDLSKLWSVFFQTPYALSVVYEATVVLIEGDEMPRRPLPVQQRNLRVLPFQQPRIDSVQVQGEPAAPITDGTTLLITGQQLQGDITLLRFGRDVMVTPDSVSDTEIILKLVGTAFPANALRAGVQGVQVVQQVEFGSPGDPHAGFDSNVAPFVLHPRVTAVNVNPGGHVIVSIVPPVRDGQRATLLLNASPGTPHSVHSFTLPPAAGNLATLDFTVSGVGSGDYFVRVQVDGAESPLDFDPASTTFGPTVTFP